VVRDCKHAAIHGKCSKSPTMRRASLQAYLGRELLVTEAEPQAQLLQPRAVWHQHVSITTGLAQRYRESQ
jgi:hypothetical protein